jgi:hypothetical protein
MNTFFEQFTKTSAMAINSFKKQMVASVTFTAAFYLLQSQPYLEHNKEYHHFLKLSEIV